MLIKEVVLNNFRIYKGHHRLSFAADVHKNIHIISGNNGYGKTTFLTSFNVVNCFNCTINNG